MEKGGGSMEEKDVQTMIEEDLQQCYDIWEKYPQDIEQLDRVFQMLLQHYEEKIDGFDQYLYVIQNRKNIEEMAEVYRRNILCLVERLQAFQENGYTNEGLMEYYIQKEEKEIDHKADFTSVRIALGMSNLPFLEKEEIIEKLNEMEEICAKVVPKSKKWEALRQYLIWLSGKDADTAMQILPLFFRINDSNIKRREV